jgi:hypothetical protein
MRMCVRWAAGAQTLCDSWLEHIYQKKIKFSEHGARQLAADFGFLRYLSYYLNNVSDTPLIIIYQIQRKFYKQCFASVRFF